jgi:hypothetical protein
MGAAQYELPGEKQAAPRSAVANLIELPGGCTDAELELLQ